MQQGLISVIVLQGGSSETLYKSVHSQARIHHARSFVHVVNKWETEKRTQKKKKESFYLNSTCHWFNILKLIQIFTLPKDALIYPAHDYRGFTVSELHIPLISRILAWICLYEYIDFQVSTVGEEMLYNPRLTKDEVILQFGYAFFIFKFRSWNPLVDILLN